MREENKQMRILSAVGIILVVAGHLGYSVFDVGGLFQSSIFCNILAKSVKLCCFLILSGIWSMEFWQRSCTAQAFPSEEN